MNIIFSAWICFFPAYADVGEFDHLKCNRNVDCIIVRNSCGGAKAVNKKYEDQENKVGTSFVPIGDCERITHRLWPKNARAVCNKHRCEAIEKNK